MITYSLLVFGQPHPAERPRRVSRGKSFAWITPDRTLAAEAAVAEAFRRQNVGASPLVGDVTMTMAFYRETRRRVDVDNLAKTVMDGLTGLAWVDDSQVAELHIVRHLGCERAYTVAFISGESATLGDEAT